jgi:hypothetical protein
MGGLDPRRCRPASRPPAIDTGWQPQFTHPACDRFVRDALPLWASHRSDFGAAIAGLLGGPHRLNARGAGGAAPRARARRAAMVSHRSETPVTRGTAS